MGPGWGGALEKPNGSTWKRCSQNYAKSLLPGLFRVVPWRIVPALARPVTPEVAGSSPVAPVFRSACKWALGVACVDASRVPTTHPPHSDPDRSQGGPVPDGGSRREPYKTARILSKRVGA
jgi:hypothetical protein